MGTLSSRRHTDREYAAQMRDVRENLLRMAGHVEQMIRDASRSIIENDKDRARRTIEADHRVNRLEIEIDEGCLLILAKRHPMAGDLRFITLAMKMVTDLERIGDLAVNISERTLTVDYTPSASVCEKLEHMSSLVEAMVRDAIDAFVASDFDKAEGIFERDEEVDRLYRAAASLLERAMFESPSQVERGIHFKAAVKFLERIGDHATNLAELAIFAMRGKDVRHLGRRDG